MLAKDLPRIAAASESRELRELCRRLEEHYSYPVDSLLVGPDGSILGQRDVTEGVRGGAQGYLRWLDAAIVR